MIFALQGILVQVGPDWVALETSGGVTYQIVVAKRLNVPPLGEPLKLWTYYIVREDQAALYGFSDFSEREVFSQLLAVSGVGPRLALALIETLGAAEVVQAILKNNSRALALTPGVGPKMAQRIVLELTTRLQKWQEQTGGVIRGSAGVAPEEVQFALLALGYNPQEVGQALSQLDLSSDSPAEVWIRSAITFLSRG